MDCPLCQLPMHDPQAFYVCATNAKTEGFFEHTIQRAVAFQQECCFSCHRAMLRREKVWNGFAAVGLLTLAATVWLATYAENWLTPWCAGLAFAIMAVCAVAVALTSFCKPRKVGDQRTEQLAKRMARNLDRLGKPRVYAVPNAPDWPSFPDT